MRMIWLGRVVGVAAFVIPGYQSKVGNDNRKNVVLYAWLVSASQARVRNIRVKRKP